MTMRILKNDTDVLAIRESGQLKDVLNHCRETDERIVVPANDLKIIALTDPVDVNRHLSETEEHLAMTSDEDSAYETMADSGLFLSFRKNLEDEKNTLIPVRWTALQSLFQRAGLDCSVMWRKEEGPALGVLPTEMKADWLTKALALNKTDAKILVRDQKITSVMSNSYGFLPIEELVPLLEEELEENHPDFEFEGGLFSYEYLLLRYDIKDDLMVDSLKSSLATNLHVGVDDETQVLVQFTTSDTGLSCANARVVLKLDGRAIPLGKSIYTKHTSTKDSKIFGEECKKLGMLLKEAEDQVEKLGNTPVKFVSGCVQHIQKKFKWIPKRITESMLKDFDRRYPSGGTAMDVYLCLTQIMDRQQAQRSDLASYINTSEEYSKLLFLNYEDFDYSLVEF